MIQSELKNMSSLSSAYVAVLLPTHVKVKSNLGADHKVAAPL